MLCAGVLAVSSLVAAEPALAADAKAATGSDKAAIEAQENACAEILANGGKTDLKTLVSHCAAGIARHVGPSVARF